MWFACVFFVCVGQQRPATSECERRGRCSLAFAFWPLEEIPIRNSYYLFLVAESVLLQHTTYTQATTAGSQPREIWLRDKVTGYKVTGLSTA